MSCLGCGITTTPGNRGSLDYFLEPKKPFDDTLGGTTVRATGTVGFRGFLSAQGVAIAPNGQQREPEARSGGKAGEQCGSLCRFFSVDLNV